jgi:hypothetical protein
LAEASSLSESALALIAIRNLLGRERPSTTALTGELATDRLSIRLRPGDGQALRQRASQRDMRSSTYVAALIRAHLARNPPLAANELAALKQSVVVLATLGRVLVRMQATHGVTAEGLQQLRSAVSELERRTHELARAALISWESRSG